jgi:hypothetical protein
MAKNLCELRAQRTKEVKAKVALTAKAADKRVAEGTGFG